MRCRIAGELPLAIFRTANFYVGYRRSSLDDAVRDDGDVPTVEKIQEAVLHVLVLGPELIDPITQEIGRGTA